ncbi:MAG: CDP-diacylglycerol--glycerol-3-phosphate 3-phosphatidyltransferase [Bogoriella megaspora]|nr:MAG: CDP-diacylglycerol--glycerol-3-phosphate 3-phosphatidyltransferase [Bogoriella megaspora]
MLARPLARCVKCQLRSTTKHRPSLPSRCLSRQQKTYSTSTSAQGDTTGQSSASILGIINDELDRFAPSFKVHANQIAVLRSPDEFYETLKAKIRNAKSRIYLSTLYVGKTEHELLSTIRDALQENQELKVSILTDALRGTRESPDRSCASLLAPLISEFGPERVEIAMFHTPNLTGFRKRILPKRINEGWGLQHMKLYGVDDELIMSGANLSNDYFTNRQDRYHLFSSKDITDYFKRIHDAACSISFQVVPTEEGVNNYALVWPENRYSPSPLENPIKYCEHASQLLNPLIQPKTAPISPQTSTDTTIYPLLQFSPLFKPNDTSTELPALRSILRSLTTSTFAGSRWTFTAGYFNMTPEVRDLLISTRPASATLIAASPWANGFYGSKGVSGMLPAAYTLLSRRFLDAISAAGLSSQIVLKEWRRGTVGEEGGWTYHAKGLWVTLPGEKYPCLSLVGSSNYTKRSYSLDLEANCLIVTRNEDLMKRLGQEEQWLQEHAQEMKRDDYARTERRVGLHVRIAMAIVTLVGGAL